MFNHCHNLTNISISNWILNLYNGNMTTSTIDWFANCYNLNTININNLTIGYTTSLSSGLVSNCFQNCRNLKNINFINISFTNAFTIANSFNYCLNLKDIDLGDVDYSNVRYSINNSFNHCTNLTNVNIKAGSYIVNYISNTFYNCFNLKDITWNTNVGITFNNLKSAFNVFRNCYNLNYIDFNSVTLQGGSNVYLNNMFYNCNNLSQNLLTSFFNLLIRCNTRIRTKNLYNTNYYSPFYGTNIGKARINATGLNADLRTAGYTF